MPLIPPCGANRLAHNYKNRLRRVYVLFNQYVTSALFCANWSRINGVGWRARMA
ncbi:hypothetical protein [Methylomonas fluvii]|nr:hypothetical protein [Methylomonas fluvii]